MPVDLAVSWLALCLPRGSPDRPRELGEGIGVGDANPDPMPRLRLIPASAPLPPPTCLRQVSALARAPSASPADAVFVAGWPRSWLRYRSAPSCATAQWPRERPSRRHAGLRTASRQS